MNKNRILTLVVSSMLMLSGCGVATTPQAQDPTPSQTVAETKPQETAKPAETITPTETVKPTSVTDKYISILMRGTTLNESESRDVLSKLISVGVNSVSDCYPTVGTNVDNLMGFIVLSDEFPNEKIMLTIDKRKTGYIGIRGIDLYYASKGGVLKQISDALK